MIIGKHELVGSYKAFRVSARREREKDTRTHTHTHAHAHTHTYKYIDSHSQEIGQQL